ncbi:MAG: hypothetical protein ACUVX9_07195 [Anaerolineae bacterium]
MKRVVPAVVAVLVGLIVLLDFLLENPLLDAAGAFLLEGAIIVGASALLLGLVNLLQVHERRIRRRESGWGESVVLLVGAAGALVITLAAWRTPTLDWFYRYLLFPLEASVGALLAFAVVRAAMRLWRWGSVQGMILLIVGLLVLLGSLPGESGPLWVLGVLRNWLLDVPVLAAVRGILLGAALAITATGLRVLLLVDRPYQ